MPRKIVPPAQPDPDAASNARVLTARQKRIDAEAPVAPEPQSRESTASDPLEFLAEEFDKRYFGDECPTIERIVYGPDTLLNDPAFKQRIEQFGVQEVAQASAKAIREKGAMSQPNVVMQAALAKAIRKFGVEAVAEAFYKRVMQIPVRTVHVEIERDDEILGDPLREAVQRYGSPGMAPKFLSPRCIAELGTRGYIPVREPNGDQVKVGTLLMFEIPQRVADKRRMAAAQESIDQVKDSESAYQATVERAVREEGAKGAGSGPLATGEVVHAFASEVEESVGQQRAAGISFEV